MRIENFLQAANFPVFTTHCNPPKLSEVNSGSMHNAPLWFVHLCVSLSSPENMHKISTLFIKKNRLRSKLTFKKSDAVLGPQKFRFFTIFSVLWQLEISRESKDISRLEKKNRNRVPCVLCLFGASLRPCTPVIF